MKCNCLHVSTEDDKPIMKAVIGSITKIMVHSLFWYPCRHQAFLLNTMQIKTKPNEGDDFWWAFAAADCSLCGDGLCLAFNMKQAAALGFRAESIDSFGALWHELLCLERKKAALKWVLVARNLHWNVRGKRKCIRNELLDFHTQTNPIAYPGTLSYEMELS